MALSCRCWAPPPMPFTQPTGTKFPEGGWAPGDSQLGQAVSLLLLSHKEKALSPCSEGPSFSHHKAWGDDRHLGGINRPRQEAVASRPVLVSVALSAPLISKLSAAPAESSAGGGGRGAEPRWTSQVGLERQKLSCPPKAQAASVGTGLRPSHSLHWEPQGNTPNTVLKAKFRPWEELRPWHAHPASLRMYKVYASLPLNSWVQHQHLWYQGAKEPVVGPHTFC